MQRFHPVDGRLAARAPVQMLLDLFLLLRRQLAIQIKIGQLPDSFTFHTRSPNPARIFCVARNKQFLAASSVVSRISPIARSRIP